MSSERSGGRGAPVGAEGKRRWKAWHIVAAVLLGATIAGGGVVALVFSLTRPVVTASDTFMTALKDGNFEAAYAMGTTPLQGELGSAQRLGAMFATVRPAAWSWSNRSIRNGAGTVSGSVTYTGGHQGTVIIFLLPEGDDWKISGFRMNPQ